MISLFLDFGSQKKTIALIQGDTTLGIITFDERPVEGEILPAIEAMLTKNKSTLKDLSHIAAVTGPGGFMSLRSGLSMANALCWSLKIPIGGIHLSDLWLARIHHPLPPTPSPEGRRGALPNEYSATVEKNATNPSILEFARDMRKKPTSAESILWEELRNKKTGYKFRRQHPIQSRILDFYCDNAKLGIELDGEYHESKEQKQYDSERTEAIGDRNILILRFQNKEVLDQLERVVKKIRETCQYRTSKEEVSPLPAGEGQGERVVWLHSTQKNALFYRRFDERKNTDTSLMTLDDVRTALTKNTPLSYVGELIPEHAEALGLPSASQARSLADILPTILETIRYDKSPLLPWYGRGI